MNLKLNNDPRDAVRPQPKKAASSIKEERRRTGRYIAILVGISLLLLAIYHAWVRRIPVVASLVVPALIMFIYVAWVLYSASRDKYRALDLEAALRVTSATSPEDISPASPTNNIEISIISDDIVNRNDDPPKLPEAIKQNAKPPQVALNTRLGQNLTELTNNGQLVKPIILVNDKPPDDMDGSAMDMSKIAIFQERNIVLSEKIRAKRRFFTHKRRNVYKRSYSIA